MTQSESWFVLLLPYLLFQTIRGTRLAIKTLRLKDQQQEEDNTTPNFISFLNSDPDAESASLNKLAYYSEMTRSELFRLTWDDIDFKNGFIRLQYKYYKSDRKIPLNNEARSLLEGKPRRKDSPFVFPSRSGNQRTDMRKVSLGKK